MDTLQTWHRYVTSGDLAILDEILAEDCVFWSPVVHTPQRGRELTRMYLAAALQVLHHRFRYTREVVQAPHAVLEFECEIDGIQINGVDIITVGEDGLITEFKVMVRPLKAIQQVHAQMRAMLEALAKPVGQQDE